MTVPVGRSCFSSPYPVGWPQTTSAVVRIQMFDCQQIYLEFMFLRGYTHAAHWLVLAAGDGIECHGPVVKGVMGGRIRDVCSVRHKLLHPRLAWKRWLTASCTPSNFYFFLTELKRKQSQLATRSIMIWQWAMAQREHGVKSVALDLITKQAIKAIQQSRTVHNIYVWAYHFCRLTWAWCKICRIGSYY